jgi:ABC-type uncharacterized transport system ATPase subunit
VIAAVLELSDISKRFQQVQALRAAALRVQPGSVHALLGENGAGKTTLMRIAYGVLRPDGGVLRVRGAAVRFRSPADAFRAGPGWAWCINTSPSCRR